MEGGSTTTLGDLCEFRRGLTYKKTDEVPASQNAVLRANNITVETGEINFNEIRFIRDEIEIPESKKVIPGGLLVCTASGSKKHLGKIGLVEDDLNYAFGGFMGLLVPSERALPKYLFWLARSDFYSDFISDLSDGVNINNLKWSQLSQFQVPLPPIPEQERIVAILDEAFAAIATATANAEKNLANARELFETELNRIFSQKGDGWVEYELQELATKIGSGATPKGGAKSYKQEGISLIRSLNVHDRRFKYQKLAFIDNDQANLLSNVVVESGDVLFNITGASIARCCVVPKEVLPARVNQHVSILRPKSDSLSSDFLCYLMTSRPYKNTLVGIGEAGATRQAITKKQLQELPVEIPNRRDEQELIVSKLEQNLRKSQRLEAIYQQKHTSLTELKQSILQKAFTGELTTDTKVANRSLSEAGL